MQRWGSAPQVRWVSVALCGLVARLGAQHALSPPRGCLCRHHSPYGGDLAEERGLGRGLGLRRALSGWGGTAGCGFSQAGSKGQSLPREQGTHRGRIRPWHRALVALRAQHRGTWHPVLAVHPRRGCHRPTVPAAWDTPASCVGCRRRNTRRYGGSSPRGGGHRVGGTAAGGPWGARAGCCWQPRPLPRRALCVCGFARVCAHACAGAAGPGSVVSAIWGRPWAPPGLSESARGAAAVPLLVTSLPGDTATRKVAGGVAGPRHGQMGRRAGRCAAGEWGPYFGVL